MTISITNIDDASLVMIDGHSQNQYLRNSIAYLGSYHDGFHLGSIRDLRETGKVPKYHAMLHPVDPSVLAEFRFAVEFLSHLCSREPDFSFSQALKYYCARAWFVHANDSFYDS